MLSLLCASFVLGGGQVPPLLIVKNIGRGSAMSLSDGTVLRRSPGRIENERLIPVPGSDDAVVWNEVTDGHKIPFFAIVRGGKALRVTDTSYTVKLRYAEFDPKRAVPVVAPDVSATADNEVFIVQLATQPLEGMREAIRAAGGTITYFLAQNSYLVKLDEAAKAQVSKMPFVRWVGPYQPAYRLDPDLLHALQAGRLQTDRYNIQCYQSGIGEKEHVADLIRILGGTPLDVTDQGYVMQAILTPVQLRQVLASNDVFWVDKHSDLYPDMDIVRQIGGANYIESVAGYSGQGVRGQVRDTGVRNTHVDFQAHPLMIRANTGDTSHGTSTTGIVFGTGTGNPQGRGMLPSGQGIFLAGLTNGSTRYNETAALVQAPYFGVFESNSTGGSLTGSYTTDSFGMDDILLHMNLIICQSMSNWGTNTQVRPQAWAKNIVSVGGIKHMNTLTKADDNWTNGASIGPAADGRIKPDLSYFYDWIFTTSNASNTSYTSGFNGTSAATPITTGHFGLLYEMWADGAFGQTVTGTTVFDSRPSWPTMKAMMVNTASQYPFSGAAADLTRVHQGWGLPDVASAYDHRNDMFVIDQDVLQNLQVRTYRLYVPSGSPALRATMAYKDPGGTTSSTQHRINDLTLKVTDPGGATFYYGNNGLLASNWSSPGGVANTKDTVENVFVQNPTSGVWTVEVQANEVNQDSHLESSEVDADYSLVVTGVAPAIVPNNFATGPASLISGGLSELYTSNNQRMTLGPALTLGASTSPGPDLTVTGVSPTGTLSQLKFRIESSSTASGSLTVSLFDYDAHAYVQVGSAALTGGDTVLEPNITTNASRFVEPGTLAVKAKIHWDAVSLGSGQPIRQLVDQVRWLITP